MAFHSETRRLYMETHSENATEEIADCRGEKYPLSVRGVCTARCPLNTQCVQCTVRCLFTAAVSLRSPTACCLPEFPLLAATADPRSVEHWAWSTGRGALGVDHSTFAAAAGGKSMAKGEGRRPCEMSGG